jgi:hypothetical protein
MQYGIKFGMKKQCHPSYYHIIIYQSNETLIYDYNFFHIGFEIIIEKVIQDFINSNGKIVVIKFHFVAFLMKAKWMKILVSFHH